MSNRLAAHNSIPLFITRFSNTVNLSLSIVFCLLVCLSSGQTTSVQSSKSRCQLTEPVAMGANDVEGLKAYASFIADLLTKRDFDDLDCIAHEARMNKTRLPGGTWKLVVIYMALESPQGHATEEDWAGHLADLDGWMAAKPDSITARIALANSYVSYAWDARGDGSSETVTGSGWNLFEERLRKAKNLLDTANALPEKCPEWYLVMQNIGQGQSWDLKKQAALLQEAIAFEPEYYSYYRVQAILLLPKWYGREGDTSAFATESADRVGGKKGDVLYFQIAAKLVCRCDEPEFNRMSWERIQKGFAAVEETYGASAINLNSFALMALKFNDFVIADSAFNRIGDQWDEGTWKTRQYFEANRKDAATIAPMQARTQATMREANENALSPGGAEYRKAVEEKFAPFVQQCLQEAGADQQKFEFMLLVNREGTPENAFAAQPQGIWGCLTKELMTAQIKKERPFPPPPHPSYWVKLEVDPVASKLATPIAGK